MWRVAAIVGAVGVGLACGGLGGGSVTQSPSIIGGAGDTGPDWLTLLPRTEELALRDDDFLAVGDASDADVVLVYTDWMCGHCSEAWPVVVALTEGRADTQLRYRSFPLAAPCNPAVSAVNQERCDLAKAAVCAAQEGRFAEYAPAAWADPQAVLTGAAWTGSEMAACMEGSEADAVIAAHLAEAERVDIRGTPTFFVRRDGDWYGPLVLAQVDQAFR